MPRPPDLRPSEPATPRIAPATAYAPGALYAVEAARCAFTRQRRAPSSPAGPAGSPRRSTG